MVGSARFVAPVILLLVAVALLGDAASYVRQNCIDLPFLGGTELRSGPGEPAGRPNPRATQGPPAPGDQKTGRKNCGASESGGRDDKKKNRATPTPAKVTPSMRGSAGTRITSRSLHYGSTRQYTYRIDVENPAPGKRPGNLHVQLEGKGSQRYEHRGGVTFTTRDGVKLPRAVQDKIARDPKALRAIQIGQRRYLGE